MGSVEGTMKLAVGGPMTLFSLLQLSHLGITIPLEVVLAAGVSGTEQGS